VSPIRASPECLSVMWLCEEKISHPSC
jgi:hypothetical protein